MTETTSAHIHEWVRKHLPLNREDPFAALNHLGARYWECSCGATHTAIPQPWTFTT